MRRFLLPAFTLLFCLSAVDLPARSKDETKAAEQTLEALAAEGTRVTIRTSEGPIEVLLYDATPAHRDNFLRQIEARTYDGVIFHRSIPGFMIQAGDPSSRNTMATARYGERSAGEPVAAEIRPEFFHHAGALAAARTADEANPGRESSGSQFYIVTGEVQSDSTLNEYMQQSGTIVPPERAQVYKSLGGTPQLDGAYTIFGRVTKGMKTVERIAALPTDYADRPQRDVFIEKITIHRKRK